MDRKTALEILDLQEGATPEEITRRVNILYKKFRSIEKDEKGHTIGEVEEAYKLLCGITYRDKKAEAERKYRQEHPNPLFKLLKVDEEKARNAIYYYKWPVIIGIAVLALVLSFVLSIINKVDPQIRILITGEVYLGDSKLMEERLKQEIPGLTEMQIQNVYLADYSDVQMQQAMQTKFFLEVSDGRNDIFIVDQETYELLAKQGVFKELEPYLAQWQVPDTVVQRSQDLIMAMDINDGNTYEPKLYGLDVTDSKFLLDTGVMGERLILALGPGENPENTEAFVRNLIKQGLGNE
jgi:hypothetical protein